MRSKKALCLFFICYIAYTSIYIARLNLSMASPGLIEDAILTTRNIGLLGSMFSVIYAAGRLFNGYLSDKIRPCIMISAGLFLVAAGNLGFGLFPPYCMIVFLWGINAYAQSMLWSSVLCIVSAVYDGARAKAATSWMVTSVATGNILGILINTYLISHFGLQYAFVVPGGFALICCVAALLTTRHIAPKADPARSHISMKSLLGLPQIRTMLIPAMLHGTMKDNISLWMAVYFVDTFSIDLKQSAYYILLIPIVGLLGRVAFPPLYRAMKENEYKVSMLAFLCCIIFALPLVLHCAAPLISVLCLSGIYAAVSVINTAFLSIYPLHFRHTGNIASVSGIMDFATYLGGGISAFFYGILISHMGYTPMFLSWIILSVCSIAALFCVIRGNRAQSPQ